MSAPAPRLILHLGQHKTGSKALQSFLAAHTGRLLAHGVFYPRLDAASPVHAYAVSHHALFVRLRHAAMLAAGDPAGAARFRAAHGPADDAPLAAAFAALDAGRRRAGAAALLLSAEDLFDLHTCHELAFSPGLIALAATQLAALAAAHDYAVTLVVYVRRQDHLLAAHYAQFIKGTPDGDLAFADFAARFAPRLRTADLLQPWLAAFPGADVILRPYERPSLPAGIVPDFLPIVLGAPPSPPWPAPPSHRESLNLTPDRDLLECIRLLKRGALPAARGLTVTDLLDAALADAPVARTPAVAAWLSPADRRALLAAHAEANHGLALRFLGRDQLFLEPPPAPDEPWSPYAGLAPDRARALARRAGAAVPWRERLLRRLLTAARSLRRRLARR